MAWGGKTRMQMRCIYRTKAAKRARAGRAAKDLLTVNLPAEFFLSSLPLPPFLVGSVPSVPGLVRAPSQTYFPLTMLSSKLSNSSEQSNSAVVCRLNPPRIFLMDGKVALIDQVSKRVLCITSLYFRMGLEYLTSRSHR